MGGSGSDRRADPPSADLFPWLVTLGCLVVALVLFGHSTMPALAERDALRAVAEQKAEALRQATSEAAKVERQEATLGRDPEAVLIEMDRHGLAPDDAQATPR